MHQCSRNSNFCDLSSRTDKPQRKLRSRKVAIGCNESSHKANVNTRSGKSYATVENIPKWKLITTNKMHKDSSHIVSSEVKKVEKFNKETKKRKKESSTVINSANKNKYRKSIKKNKTSNSPALRQISLKESFMQQPLLKHLRRNKRNYCEDSKLLQQYLPLQHQDSIVILEKLDLADKKIPIYKTMNPSEASSENKNDVYDFQYDINDTKEKLIKKKKRKNVKARNKMVKKTVRKKVIIKSKLVDDGAIKSSNSGVNFVEIIAQDECFLESAITSTKGTENVSKKIDKPRIDLEEKIQTIGETISCNQTSVKQSKQQNTKKPRIVSIENADNITITKLSPDNSKDLQPMGISSDKIMIQRNTLSCSLLTKSLSPILKTYDSFDPGSPWRPPTLLFSHAKHFIQSTPNVSKVDTIHKKHMMHAKSNSHNGDKAMNLNDVENTSSSIQNMSDKINHKKNSNPCRKFGTEITNIEHLNNNNVTIQNNTEVKNDKSVTEVKTEPSVQLNIITPESQNYSSFDDICVDDKENTMPNYETPKKSMKKKIKERYLPNSSQSKTPEKKSSIQKENIESQPGSSGIKNLQNYKEQRTLRQSNLNNFLNLMDMPENTRITTKCGIFDDTPISDSTPISTIKKDNKLTTELENAFGFCEKKSELDTSSTESELPTAKVQTSLNKHVVQPIPARLSLGELKNHLIQKKSDNKLDNKQKIDDEKKIDDKKNVENKSIVDVINFSDTFDVLSEPERLSNYGTNIPLFVDLEPSHFSRVLINIYVISIFYLKCPRF